MSLNPAIRAARGLNAAAEVSGRAWSRLTRPQLAYLALTASAALLRGGNQIGKSTVLSVDAVDFARGVHLFDQTHRPPVQIVVAGPSWEQMEPLMSRIWDIIPKDEIDERNAYDPGRGITGKPPRLVFVRGPGAGSVINFATYEQGVKRIAGGTKHRIILDEPPPEDILVEAATRLLRHRGHLRVGFTPVPGMADVGYLRKLVAEGAVAEVNAKLCEDSCWPVGALRPWLTQAEIDATVALWPAAQRGIRVNGDWEPLTEGAWLSAFDDTCLMAPDEPVPGGAHLMVGGDHGTDPGKQRFMLVAIVGKDTDRPRVWWLDEWAPDGFSTPEEDAKGILGMLARNGPRVGGRLSPLTYDHIDDWVADRSAQTKEGHVRKSNARLAAELARALGRRMETMKFIGTPRKYAGSVADGYALINALFARRDGGRPHGLVHPRCVQFIQGCRTFRGGEREPCKDVLDAGRYPVERACRRREWLGLSMRVVFRVIG